MNVWKVFVGILTFFIAVLTFNVVSLVTSFECAVDKAFHLLVIFACGGLAWVLAWIVKVIADNGLLRKHS